jgi:tetratricopeptide (TPR) repeat protein
MSDFHRAEAACREALSLREANLPPGAAELGHTHEALGVVEQSLGDMRAAKADYLRALDIFSHAGDVEREGLASAHHDLGFLAFHEGDNATALSEYRKAYDIKQALFGDVHPSTLNSLNMIAQTEQALGDLDAARADFEKVLRLRVQVLGAESSVVAHTENDLGALLQDQGDFTEAERHYRIAYTLHAKLSPDSLDLATTANNLGTLYEDRGDFEAAVAMFRESLDIRSRKFQAPHPSLARAQHNFARCLLEMGRPKEARPLLDAALAARKQIEGIPAERFDSELLDVDLRLAGGDPAGAERALGELKPLQGAGQYRRRARYTETQARIAAAHGNWTGARDAEHQAGKSLAEKLTPANPLCAQVAVREAQYAAKAHDDAHAAELVRSALPVLRQELAPMAPDRIAAERLAATLDAASAKRAVVEIR